jgi:hypothetical protein
MSLSFAKLVAGMVVVTLMQPALMLARDSKQSSWQNLQQLTAGQRIEVTKTDGRSVRGTFVSFADQSISVHGKQQDVTISRTDVARVQLRPNRRGRYMWIGAAVGAGAGAAAGAGAGLGQIVSVEI